MATRTQANSLFMIGLVLVAGMAVIGWVLPGTKSDPQVPLGTWKNMPSTVSEFMGNTSYRGIVQVTGGSGETGFNVALFLNCINPSNTLGATLQLQYANFSTLTNLNTSNFANLASGSLKIDNSANFPCPGQLISGNTLMPAIQGNPAFLFRVVGSGGGGTGDNPRFSAVSVSISQSISRFYETQVAGITTAHFLWKGFSSIPVATQTTFNIDWLATNETSMGCSVVTSSCLQSGTSSCTILINSNVCSATITVTFVNAFTGTPNVVTQVTGIAPGSLLISLGTISLLQAQTLTV